MKSAHIFWLTFLLLVGCSSQSPTPTPSPELTNTSEPTPQPTHTPLPVNEADANVTFVRAVETSSNVWTFHVTVEHPDTGWEDYADGWDVVLPDGTVVKKNEDDRFTRLLLHPHENEQPFTRSQSRLMISAEITQLTVRAHDIMHGFGGEEVTVDLTMAQGDQYEVERP